MQHAELRIRLVIFDWAGTTIDHGSLAPLAPFLRAFAEKGVEISPDEARGPMGLHKKDHIRALLQLPAVAQAGASGMANTLANRRSKLCTVVLFLSNWR